MAYLRSDMTKATVSFLLKSNILEEEGAIFSSETPLPLVVKRVQWNPALQSPCCYSHFILAQTKTQLFSYLKYPVNRAGLLWPVGDRCSTVLYQQFENHEICLYKSPLQSAYTIKRC